MMRRFPSLLKFIRSSKAVKAAENGDRGFTMVEAIIALLLMMIVALGAASLFSFSIYHNSGGVDRASSLAIAQQALETLRVAEFSSVSTSALLNGGTVVQNGIVRDQRTFRLTRIIDDDPSTLAVDVNPATNLKQIRVEVRPQNIGFGWTSGAYGTVTLITQRTKAE